MVTRFVGLIVCFAWVWLSPALACERPTPQSNAQHRIVIASGELQGLYNPIGGALCRIASNAWADAKKDDAQDKRCAVRPTQGSSENLALLTSCQVDFAILQRDVFDAAAADPKLPKLQKVTELHDEFFTVIVRKTENELTYEDLSGMKIYAGAENSGHRFTALKIADLLGSGSPEFAQLSPATLRRWTLGQLLCDDTVGQDKIDGIIQMIGPNSLKIREILSQCGAQVQFLSVPAKALGEEFTAAELSGAVSAQGGAVETFKMPAYLVGLSGQEAPMVEGLKGAQDTLSSYLDHLTTPSRESSDE